MSLPLPWWMTTRAGQWLARHWRPAAVYWRVRMEVALIEEAQRDEDGARVLLLVALNRLLEAGELPPALLRSWIWWRNQAERRYRLECELVGYELPRNELEGARLASEGWEDFGSAPSERVGNGNGKADNSH